MPNRILREGILTSEAVNSLSPGAEIFYRRLMSVVDDFGRLEAHPQILLARCYPLQLDSVGAQDVSTWLAECAHTAGKCPLVVIYSVDGKKFLQVSNFGQRERTPKHPGPEFADKCAQDASTVRESAARASNPHTNTNTPPNTNTNTNTAAEKKPTLPNFGPYFERVIGAFLAAGVKLSEPQILQAAQEWIKHPEEEHPAIAACAETRARRTEQKYMGLPARWLEKREWDARGPGRLLPEPPRDLSKSERGQAEAERRFLEKKGVQ